MTTVDVTIVEGFIVEVRGDGEVVGWRGLTPEIVTHYLQVGVQDEAQLSAEAETAGGVIPFSTENAGTLLVCAREDRFRDVLAEALGWEE